MRAVFVFILFLFVACSNDDEGTPAPRIPDYVYAGGDLTIFDATSNAFSTPAPNLSTDNFERHLGGDLTFEQIFVTAPAEVNPGLGPLFNNNSCVSCHIRNGRSEPSVSGDELSGFLIRISIDGTGPHGGAMPVPNFGTQLQNRAIFGTEREANFTLEEVDEIIAFADGMETLLSKPTYSITEPYTALPADVKVSPRVAPVVFGLGLVEAIPESAILAHADEFDQDGDGISGKPNRVWNVQTQSMALGRFGWKAESPTGLQQSAEAYQQDMGITSPLFTEENCNDQPNCIGSEHMAETDIDMETLELTNFYFQTLAVPAMRNYDDPDVLRGRELFMEVQCSSCHVPSFTTGSFDIPELERQTIFPYSDFLLHDMGEGLADNRPSFSANGQEWRTPPLWGIGLLPVVNGHMRLMHDGRARGINEAILWHGGEAEGAKDFYKNLILSDREALVDFVRAL